MTDRSARSSDRTSAAAAQPANMENPMPATLTLSPADAARAVGHPLRARLLAALDGRTLSPVELSINFAEPIGNVSFHIRRLHALGAIRLVRTRQVRGAVQHYYTATVRIRLDQEPIE